VVSAINEARNTWLQQYYLSSLCRNTLLEYYPVERSDYSGHFDAVYDPLKTTFQNHRHPNEPERQITLQEFRNYFQQFPPMSFLNKVNRLMEGTEGHPGAEACVDELVKQGLDKADFTKIKACVEALEAINIQDRFLRNYCLPTLEHREYKKP